MTYKRPASPTADRVKKVPRRSRPTKSASPTPMDTASEPGPDLPRGCDCDTTPMQLTIPFWDMFFSERIWTPKHPEEGQMTISELTRRGKREYPDHPTYVIKSEVNSRAPSRSITTRNDSFTGLDPIPEKQRPASFT